MKYKEIVKNYEDVDPLLRLALVDLSNSRIETFEGDWGCEAKYFYNYIIKEEDPSNPSAKLGNVIHKVLENLIENDKQFDEEEYVTEYKIQLEEQDDDQFIDNDLRQLGLVMVKDFVEENKTNVFSKKSDRYVYQKELGFDIIIGRAKMRGYIDRIDISGDTVFVVDYKSGRHEYPTKHIHKNLQLGIYALAVKMMFPDKKVHASLHYLRTGKKKGHLFTDDDLNGVVDRILDITEKIVSKTNFAPTTNQRICRYCPHAKSGVCASGARVLNQPK